jgi:hypothetical protein
MLKKTMSTDGVMAKKPWLGFSYNPKIPSCPFATRRKLVMALFDAQFVSKKE